MARRKSGKKKLSSAQEFEIMKLVLDKFLWLGFVVMAWGMYQTLHTGLIESGIYYLGAGAILLLLFVIIIVKEYEIIN